MFQKMKFTLLQEVHCLKILKTFRLLNCRYQILTSRSLFVEANSFSDSKQPVDLYCARDERPTPTKIYDFLNKCSNRSVKGLEKVLHECGLVLDEEMVLEVLRRCKADWKLAFMLFNYVTQQSDNGRNISYFPGSRFFNEILDILGRMKRFEELDQVFDQMSKRKGLVDERTFEILFHRYASARKVEEAIHMFYKRSEFGLQLDLVAFRTLLMSLCRYKLVEEAEPFFHSKLKEFPPDIKTLNIILNGWCVLGNVYETKRFWKDILAYRKCKPDVFTYSIFLNALTKSGKLGGALKVFHGMWKKGSTVTPDVAICNCIISALCFKKRIPEALEIFEKMSQMGCAPNVATYNSLIKYLCQIRRMDKVYELLEEMKCKKESCEPNSITYNYLLKSMLKPEDVFELLEKLRGYCFEITNDTHNLILKLFMVWNHVDGIQSMWIEMERNGVGPDQRSYTIMVHGLYKRRKMEEALSYFNEMKTKGMIPEPRTMILIEDVKTALKKEKERRDAATKF